MWVVRNIWVSVCNLLQHFTVGSMTPTVLLSLVISLIVIDSIQIAPSLIIDGDAELLIYLPWLQPNFDQKTTTINKGENSITQKEYFCFCSVYTILQCMWAQFWAAWHKHRKSVLKDVTKMLDAIVMRLSLNLVHFKLS